MPSDLGDRRPRRSGRLVQLDQGNTAVVAVDGSVDMATGTIDVIGRPVSATGLRTPGTGAA